MVLNIWILALGLLGILICLLLFGLTTVVIASLIKSLNKK